jgi:hypothetical protein
VPDAIAVGRQAGASADSSAERRDLHWSVKQAFACCLHLRCSPSVYTTKFLARLDALRAAGCRDYVPPDVLREAQQWANFAIAAYGSSAYLWNQPRSEAVCQACGMLEHCGSVVFPATQPSCHRRQRQLRHDLK